jgi:hypothetical protein
MIHPFSGKLDESRPTPTAYLFSRQERVQESEINEGEMDASKNENIKGENCVEIHSSSSDA